MIGTFTEAEIDALTKKGHEFISDALGYERGGLELATDSGRALALRVGLFLEYGQTGQMDEAKLVDEAWELIDYNRFVERNQWGP